MLVNRSINSCDLTVRTHLHSIEEVCVDLACFEVGTMDFKTIQFYAAEMVIILEYLHSRGLAHRDFKVISFFDKKERDE